MTTHPTPTHPGPTGPTRSREAAERWLDAHANRRPTYAEVLADAQRLLTQALAVLDRTIDPASYPQGMQGHLADAGFEVVGFHLEAAGRELAKMAALTNAPVRGLTPGVIGPAGAT